MLVRGRETRMETPGEAACTCGRYGLYAILAPLLDNFAPNRVGNFGWRSMCTGEC